MTSDELRSRIDAPGSTYREAAVALSLSLSGLNHQMRGVRRVSLQTEILLERLEDDHQHRLRTFDLPPAARRDDRCEADEAVPSGDGEGRITR